MDNTSKNITLEKVQNIYSKITAKLIEKDLSITAMESCTAGLIASLITDTEGSSEIFKGSFVTYSNEAKISSGVPSGIIDKYGVYSKETSEAMASACKTAFNAYIGIGITGSFGNVDPVNKDSKPGEVFFTMIIGEKVHARHLNISNAEDRFTYKLTVAKELGDLLLSLL